ncbi:unnamed protein product, partial [marine sediment metagenome]
ATTNQTCAVMLEPVEAEGGVNIPDDKYLAVVQAWCNQKGILLILDEIQTGVGRMGTLFASAPLLQRKTLSKQLFWTKSSARRS